VGLVWRSQALESPEVAIEHGHASLVVVDDAKPTREMLSVENASTVRGYQRTLRVEGGR